MSTEVGETRGFPEELLLKSLTFLNVAQLVTAARVCRRWHRLSEDDTLWEKHLQKLEKHLKRKRPDQLRSFTVPDYSVDALKWGGARMPGQSYRDVYISILRKKAEDTATYQKAMEEYNSKPAMPSWGHYACGMRPPRQGPRAAFGERPNPPKVNALGGVAGFTTHPNRSSAPIAKLSTDITTAMQRTLEFLQLYGHRRGDDGNPNGITYVPGSSGARDNTEPSNPVFLESAVARYKRFMHLKAKFGTDVLLVPTADIELVWQAHLIRPTIYAADCEKLCARLVDHCVELATYESYIFPSAALRTAQLYWEAYQTHYISESHLWSLVTAAAASSSEAHVTVPGHSHPVLRGALGGFLAPCAARVKCCPDASKAEWMYHCSDCNLTFCSTCVEAGKAPAVVAAPAASPSKHDGLRFSRFGRDDNPAPQRPSQQRSRSYLGVTVAQDVEPAVPTEEAVKAAAWPIGMTGVCDVKQDAEWIRHFKSYMPSDDTIFSDGHTNQTWMDVLPKAYERFLYMAARYPPADGEYVHPTYAIDLAWHAHMLHPVAYASDCRRLVGHIVDHEPWPPVAEDTKADSHNKTDELWKKEFGISIHDEHRLTTMGAAGDGVMLEAPEGLVAPLPIDSDASSDSGSEAASACSMEP